MHGFKEAAESLGKVVREPAIRRLDLISPVRPPGKQRDEVEVLGEARDYRCDKKNMFEFSGRQIPLRIGHDGTCRMGVSTLTRV